MKVVRPVAVLAASCALCVAGAAASPLPVKSGRTVGVSVGKTYRITVSGPGSVGVFGGAEAVVTRSQPVDVTARSATLALVPNGQAGDIRLTRVPRSPLDVPVRRKCVGASAPRQAGRVMSADLVVIGAQASGLGAAVAAARRCLSVILVSAEPVVGGMLSAGQIGFTDGTPVFYWPERTRAAGFPNGEVPSYTSWSTAGGLWLEFRERVAIASGLPAAAMSHTERYEPRFGKVAANGLIANLPTLHVLYSTTLRDATLTNGRIDHADVVGGWSGTLKARYWVDGTDAGDLVAAAGLPYNMGEQDADHPNGTNEVMSYAYRWTAVEQDVPGMFPTAPPMYYALNKPLYVSATPGRWAAYQQDFEIPDGAAYSVHPFRLFNNQGRLTGVADAPLATSSGGPTPGAPPEEWDVNAGVNDASSYSIGRMLASNPDVLTLFGRYGMPNPYASPATSGSWSNISYVEDERTLSDADRLFLIARIQEAVKARAFGFLWYVRSGDLLQQLHKLPGAANVTVRSHWSISNQLGTPDGMPSLMYQREGRRVVGEGYETVTDICPTYAADSQRADRVCQSAPPYMSDAIAVGDYFSDIHETGTQPPQDFTLPFPHTVSFRALIPKGTTGLLVGSAISADRVTYSAFRVDPLRLMIGTAVGEAVAQAVATNNPRFQSLDVRRLRSTLADDYQPTFYTQWAPSWNSARQAWSGFEVAKAIQKLVAMGWLSHAFGPTPPDGTTILNPSIPLGGNAGLELWREVRGNAGVPAKPPWNVTIGKVTMLATLTGTHVAGVATVGDAYIWLANQLPKP